MNFLQESLTMKWFRVTQPSYCLNHLHFNHRGMHDEIKTVGDSETIFRFWESPSKELEIKQ